MAGRRVQHWKHGWIPVSPEAKAFAAGRGPRPVTGAKRAKLPMPGDPDWSPNNEYGIPTSRKISVDHKTEADVRVADIKDVVPEINPRPERAFPSQSMAAHHTGGVVIDADDMDRLLDKIESRHEGTATRLDAAESAGLVGSAKKRLTTNTAKGNAEEQALRRARRLKNYLGLTRTPMPTYEKVNDFIPGAGRYTGAVTFDPASADQLVAKLNDFFTGRMTRFQGRRAAGF